MPHTVNTGTPHIALIGSCILALTAGESWVHCSIICKEKKGEREGKSRKKAQYWHHKLHVSLLTPQSGARTHTHCYSARSAPFILQPKKQRERFSTHTHTSNWHLISQPKGWLAQRWLRLCLCPTQRTTLSSHWPWDLPLSCFSTLLSFLLPLSPPFFISSLPPSPSPLSFLPLLFCLFSLFPPHSVLHHSALPLSFHTAREGSRGKTQALERKKKKKEGEGGNRSGWGRKKSGRLPLCLQAISYSLGCRWNLIPTAFTCQVWLLASLIK